MENDHNQIETRFPQSGNAPIFLGENRDEYIVTLYAIYKKNLRAEKASELLETNKISAQSRNMPISKYSKLGVQSKYGNGYRKAILGIKKNSALWIKQRLKNK